MQSKDPDASLPSLNFINEKILSSCPINVSMHLKFSPEFDLLLGLKSSK